MSQPAHPLTLKSLYLAPMEGVMDHLMRDLLTQIGGYDLCVTEFIRVVDHCFPERVFYRFCPELYHGGKTPSGTPVRIQLLGQHPQFMGDNAQVACELSSPGIDLNFGCPAKAVKKSLGGAMLLKQPELMYQVIRSVREAVPSSLPVSAKIRLGWDDTSLLEETIDAINQANASELVVHARTKSQGYRPPAQWHELKRILTWANMPVIANGDINDTSSAKACMQASGCDLLMVGRGALAQPDLAQILKTGKSAMTWQDLLLLLRRYSDYEVEGDKGKYYSNRIKQWLVHLKRNYPQANELFAQIRTLKKAVDVLAVLDAMIGRKSA